MPIDPEDILNFWFTEIGPGRWFEQSPALDAAVRERYLSVYEQAKRDELVKWEETPEGALALLLLLDAFPRRLFREDSRCHATDDRALELARSAILRHFDDRIDAVFKLFFYLPFSHSENLGDQRLAVYYIRERTKDPRWVDYAEERMRTIQHFGRFPHRNKVLNRKSTDEEEEYLAQLDAKKQPQL